MALAERPIAGWREQVRGEELAALRQVPLGNALFTRASFEAEYGLPELIGAPQDIDLGDGHPEHRCIYCEGRRFRVETYATDRPGIQLRFWWCHGCGLGHAVAWGHLDDHVL
jgi:hypothetical protein